MSDSVIPDPSRALRRFTPARIGLGRAGDSLPTREVLAFGLAHAQARDAVHAVLRPDELERALGGSGFATLRVHSAASDRAAYLRRPDLGRQLDPVGRARLSGARAAPPPDAVVVFADGLSAQAVHAHALPVLVEVSRHLQGWRLGPVVIAEQSRVALGDEIGDLLGASIVVMLIGERPGLSAPDSLGIYLTWEPRPGRTDAERNCISNVRREGLDYPSAAATLAWLMHAARRAGLTGVRLKDEPAISTDSTPPEGHITGVAT